MKVLKSQKTYHLELVEIKTDNQWSLFCRSRDRNHCRIGLKGCKKKAIEVHHVFTRSILALRLNPDNGLSVCRFCHNYLEDNPVENFDICRKVLGEEVFSKIYAVYIKETKIDAEEYYKRVKQSRKK